MEKKITKQYRVLIRHEWVEGTMQDGGCGHVYKSLDIAQGRVRRVKLDPHVIDAWVECREVTPWEKI